MNDQATVPRTPEAGYQTRQGKPCNCCAQLLGVAICAWCGGSYPPLTPELQQLKQRVAVRVNKAGQQGG
jgi:hypothetical protein